MPASAAVFASPHLSARVLRADEVRVRENIDTGGRLNTLRVMVKPLAAAGTSDLACYLASVPRDQPGSTLP